MSSDILLINNYFLVIFINHIILASLYCFAIDFTLENNYDTFNFWAYIFSNIFDFDGLDKLRYFEDLLKLLSTYFLSILTFFGRIEINHIYFNFFFIYY